MDMISHEPLVYTLKGVLTELECQHFINISSDKMKRSSVSGYDEKNKRKDELDNRRTSSSCWVTHDDNSITREVVERISKLVQIPSSHSEAYQVVHYENSQEYQPHLDTFDPNNQGYSPYLKNGGQRVVTALAYLNDVIEGGETVFPNLDKSVTPEKGKIFFDKNSLTDMKEKERRLLRQEMGIVFQGSALFDSMNVEENIMFPMKMFTNKNIDEMLHRANEVIDRVNLKNSNKKMPSELSGGMQKRVAIARAIVMNPKFLFCDEPNSGLDPRTSILIDNLIHEITKEYNITTVINTHDMNSVMEIGENIIFLQNGNKEWEGTNQEIFQAENKSFIEFVYSSEILKKARKVLKK